MAKLPKKFVDRVKSRLRQYQNVAVAQRSKDVSEADTVTVVKDILADVFGYDKYTELTSEQQIRGTFCDLAVQIDEKIRFLIEVKSAGSSLSESHLRQAINYGAHQGIEWIVLTNAVEWRFYKVKFTQPIDWEEVVAFCFPELSARSEDDLQKLFLLAREGLAADAISAFHQQTQLFNPFTVAQVTMSDPVASVIRRELRKAFPELKVDQTAVLEMLERHVVKRELVAGEKSDAAKDRLKRASQRAARAAKKAAQD